jgi:hypothetical protein
MSIKFSAVFVWPGSKEKSSREVIGQPRSDGQIPSHSSRLRSESQNVAGLLKSLEKAGTTVDTFKSHDIGQVDP